MIRFYGDVGKLFLAGIACIFAGAASGQTTIVAPVRHVGFDTPDGWAMKYFTSATMLSGLQPPEPLGEHARIGGVTLGLELGWLPALRPGQAARVLFRGPNADDLNKVPVVVRPSVRVGLPWRFTAVAAVPAPVQMFGVTPRLFAFGLERPILERKQWTLGWRASGQVGSVKGDYTCPQRVVEFPAGSADVVSLRYGGTEVQFAYRNPRFRRIIPHVAAGINFIDNHFQVDAQLSNRVDRTQLWTRGMAFNGTAGVSYLFTNRAAFTVDAFYSPLGVQRDPTRPRTIDGLFNVRALISYTLR